MILRRLAHSQNSRSFSVLKPIAVLAFFMLATSAVAAHVEVQGGRSYMDTHGSNAVFVEGVMNEQPLGGGRLTWSPDVSLGWIAGRDIDALRGGRYDPRHAVALAAAGVRFHYGDKGDWYRPLFFSFQPALAHHRTQALSTPYEFVSTLGWQGQHLSFQIRHISNGHLHQPNRGETMALLGVGFDW